jgi:hypothetical protein
VACVVPCVRFNDVVRPLTAEICVPVSRLVEVVVVPASTPRFSLSTVYLKPVLAFSFITATLGTNGWLGLVRQGLSPCKKRQALLGAPTVCASGQCGRAWTLFGSRKKTKVRKMLDAKRAAESHTADACFFSHFVFVDDLMTL